MTCASCQKVNLPGGVRCIYCGKHFHPGHDFEIKAASVSQRASTAPESALSKNARGCVPTIALLALKLKSLLVALKFGKLALTFGSMLVYISVYSHIFGWRFSVGLAVCILIHELGHVAVNRMNGLPASAPMFIPFVGAMIFVKRFPDDPKIQSECGAGGPAAGLLAGIACIIIGKITNDSFWFVLASFDALINLVNMVPFTPLDGSHVCTVFSPRLFNGVLITLLLCALKIGFGGQGGQFAIVIAFIVIVGFINRLGVTRDTRYLLAPPSVRLRMAGVFIGLCVFLTLLGAYANTSAASLTNTINASAEDRAALNRVASSLQEEQGEAAQSSAESVILIGLAFLAAAVSTFVLWPVTFAVLNIASGSKNSKRAAIGGVLAGSFNTCLFVIFRTLHVHNPGLYLGAIALAGTAAVVFAGYAASHRDIFGSLGYTLLVTHACLWASGAVLLIVFASSQVILLPVALLPVLAAVLAWRWLPAYFLGSAAVQIGAPVHARKWYGLALASAPLPDATRHLYLQIADLELSLGCGSAAIAALDGAQSADPDLLSILLRSKRTTALLLQDRHGEALVEVEQLLGISKDDPLVNARLAIAHRLLAQASLLQGWYDEAASQTERALLRTADRDRDIKAELILVRANCLYAVGKPELARADIATALKLSQVRAVKEAEAAITARMQMDSNRADEAVKTTEQALRELQDGLELQFLKGKALLTTGRSAEGLEILRNLASSYPKDHWGRAAAEAAAQ